MRDRQHGAGGHRFRSCRARRHNRSNGTWPDRMRLRTAPIDGPASECDALAGFAGVLGFAEVVGVDEPVDVVAVRADDELINALAAGMFVSAPGLHDYHNCDDGDRVVAMLAAWKAGIDAEPLPPLLDAAAAAAAAATVAVSRAVGNPARRYLMPLAGAAALVVSAIAGVSVGARSAGDTLWGVSKVLYSEHAHSVEAAVGVAGRLEKVRTALAAGQTELAAQELAATVALLDDVAPEDGVSQLVQQQQFLTAKMSETPPNTETDPNAPLRNGQANPAVTSAGRTPAGSPDGSSTPGSSAPGPSLPGSSLPGSSTAPRTKPSPPPPPAADPPVLRAPLPPPVPIPVRSPVPDPAPVLPAPVLPAPVLPAPVLPAPVLPAPDPQTTTASPRPTTAAP